MSEPHAIGDWVFHADFATARRRDGREIRFTRSRARHPNQVLSRDRRGKRIFRSSCGKGSGDSGEELVICPRRALSSRRSRLASFFAVLAVQAVEEAVVNAMVAAEDRVALKPAGLIVRAIDTDRLRTLIGLTGEQERSEGVPGAPGAHTACRPRPRPSGTTGS